MDIDVEEESVLTAIFKDAFPESWQQDPNFIHYLAELSSFGVEKLAQEPDRLTEEKAQILEETQNLAFQNYKTFIQTAECSREIFEDFQIIEGHVGCLLEKLPQFSDHCNTVLKKAQDITSSRRMNTLTLQRHTQLLEILELPQLMDTCVRNGYYDEALELASHVKRMEKKHSTIPVIGSIVNEVKSSSQLMLNQLIQQLRTNVQLPACLRVIGYLRRMDVFTEAELRIKFLQARDSWFQALLEAVPKEDAYTHITKTIEVSRVNLFDIITQYRAIFSDEDPLLSSSRDDTLNESALFHGWIIQKVSQFLTTLEQDLARGVGGRLDSILGQCMYFGLSFSRVGADFRGLLTPIFQTAALSGLQVALLQANKRFEDNMRSYSLLSSQPGGSGLPYNPSSKSGQLYPPTLLLDFLPLAAYCNDLLTALNDLRLCAPVAIVTEVVDTIQQSFINVNKIILAFHRAEETTFDRKEKEKFDQFCGAYAHSLIPYINRCLQALFPPTQLAQILGVTVSELLKMDNLGQVDMESSLKNVKHLIPDQELDTTPALPSDTPVVDSSALSHTSDQANPLQATGKLGADDEATVTAVPGKDQSLEGKEVDETAAVTDTAGSTNTNTDFEQGTSTGAESENKSDVVPSEAASSDDPATETLAPADSVEDTGNQQSDVQPAGSQQTGPQLTGTLDVPAEPVRFSLSDNEEEFDLDKTDLDDLTIDRGGGNDDVESDLSALAADVLGTN